MTDSVLTGLAVAAPLVLTVILTHVASSRRREGKLGVIDQRLSKIETDVQWIKDSIPIRAGRTDKYRQKGEN